MKCAPRVEGGRVESGRIMDGMAEENGLPGGGLSLVRVFVDGGDEEERRDARMGRNGAAIGINGMEGSAGSGVFGGRRARHNLAYEIGIPVIG